MITLSEQLGIYSILISYDYNLTIDAAIGSRRWLSLFLCIDLLLIDVNNVDSNHFNFVPIVSRDLMKVSVLFTVIYP